jgi:hypothetical protein
MADCPDWPSDSNSIFVTVVAFERVMSVCARLDEPLWTIACTLDAAFSRNQSSRIDWKNGKLYRLNSQDMYAEIEEMCWERTPRQLGLIKGTELRYIPECVRSTSETEPAILSEWKEVSTPRHRYLFGDSFETSEGESRSPSQLATPLSLQLGRQNTCRDLENGPSEEV